MDKIKQEGKTVDEAVKEALNVLNISEKEAKVKVLEEGKKGFLGLIGGKNALVEVTVKK